MKLISQTATMASLVALSHALATTTVPLKFTGSYYTTTVEIGGQPFELVVDAGSSTLWVPNTEFTCINTNNNTVWANSNCGFVNSYNSSASPTFNSIPDTHISEVYGIGLDYVGGPAGLDTVTIGGIDFPNQEFMRSTLNGWQGENLTNGIWGFAYPPITHVYNGTTPSISDFGNGKVSKSLPEPENFLPRASSERIITPVVGLALEATQEIGGYGGLLTIGGTPNVSTTSPFITLPIQKTSFLAAPNNRLTDIANPPLANDTYEYAYYTIKVDGVSVETANRTKTFAEPYLAYVDSGSPVTSVSLAIAREINHAFVPPAIYSSEIGEFVTFCNATPPTFVFTFGNTSFVSNPAALLTSLEPGSEFCASLVTNSTNYVKTIGAPFLTGVVAVFDQGNNTVSFASTVGGAGNSTGSGTTGGSSPTYSPVPVVTTSMGVRLSDFGGLLAVLSTAWGFILVL